MPDPKLVDALAREIVPLVAFWNGEEDTHPDDCSDAAWIEAREMAAAFFNHHRLVQLPEKPSGWVDDASFVTVRHRRAMGFDTDLKVYAEDAPRPAHPVYILPGDTQEVEP